MADEFESEDHLPAVDLRPQVGSPLVGPKREIPTIREVPSELNGASFGPEAFSMTCSVLCERWSGEATLLEYVYIFAAAMTGLSSMAIAVFASPNSNLVWVKIAALIGMLATPVAGFFHLKASATRQAHDTLGTLLTRYRLGKSDLTALLDAHERAMQQYREWLPKSRPTKMDRQLSDGPKPFR
jgi:hypothetical protein